jgi:hypothetical protein
MLLEKECQEFLVRMWTNSYLVFTKCFYEMLRKLGNCWHIFFSQKFAKSNFDGTFAYVSLFAKTEKGRDKTFISLIVMVKRNVVVSMYGTYCSSLIQRGHGQWSVLLQECWYFRFPLTGYLRLTQAAFVFVPANRKALTATPLA